MLKGKMRKNLFLSKKSFEKILMLFTENSYDSLSMTSVNYQKLSSR